MYTCKIIIDACIHIYVYMQDNYVYMQVIYVYMQDNYVHVQEKKFVYIIT